MVSFYKLSFLNYVLYIKLEPLKVQNLAHGVIGQSVRWIVAMEKPLEQEAVYLHAPTLMSMTKITVL